MFRRKIEAVMKSAKTIARCETCNEEFLRISTMEFIAKTGTTRGHPDKWLVYALEHFYHNPDHELGCYTNGIRNMKPNFELQNQIAKTNPEEIERFKIIAEALPF